VISGGADIVGGIYLGPVIGGACNVILVLAIAVFPAPSVNVAKKPRDLGLFCR
jgi:hypothetical protein